MTTSIFSFIISSKGFGDIIDITDNIVSYSNNISFQNGVAYIYNDSNNVAIKNIEIKELKDKMYDKNYQKIIQFGNDNILILPIIDTNLYINEMSRILFIDFEQSANMRKIIVMLQTWNKSLNKV